LRIKAKMEEFREFERAARTNNRGLWGTGQQGGSACTVVRVVDGDTITSRNGQPHRARPSKFVEHLTIAHSPTGLEPEEA
jgi:endonuclease YncB( thermonuclease family)